jgi:hypothetical protein
MAITGFPSRWIVLLNGRAISSASVIVVSVIDPLPVFTFELDPFDDPYSLKFLRKNQ